MRLSRKEREAVIRGTFEAIANVGFLKWWRSEQPEELRNTGQTGEQMRQEYLEIFEEFWPEYQKILANASDDRLLDVRQDWIEIDNAVGYLEWQRQNAAVKGEKLALNDLREEAKRPGQVTYKNRDMDLER